MENLEAYCIKCKKKVIIEKPVEDFWPNGTRVAKGKCPNCQTKIFRILPKKKEGE